MIININAIKKEESGFCFLRDAELNQKCGLIAYVPGEFFCGTTKMTLHEALGTNFGIDGFYKDFKSVLSYLNKTVLRSKKHMETFCEFYPNSKIFEGIDVMNGFRIDTEKYVYFLKCCLDENKTVSKHDFYIFCYNKSVLEQFCKAA